jgi:tetratricopeptide (TPR) repeat protein
MVAALLAALPAFAADTNVERDFEIALTKGQYALELRDFSTAIQYLTKALALKPRDQVAKVSLGIAYSQSGDNARARDILQQAVAADASDGRARYELALVLVELGKQEEARSQMAFAARSADPEVSAAARGFLERTGPVEKKQFTAKVAGGLQYDSNVILEQDSPVTSGVKNSDWRALFTLNGAYTFLNAGRAEAKGGYIFYQTAHQDLTDYNVQQHIGRLAGKYNASKTVNVDLEYDFIYSFVGGDHYSTSHLFAFRLPANLTPESLSELHASYEAKRFFDTPVFTGQPDRNGSDTSIGVGHTIMLGKKSGIAFDYTYDRNAAAVDSWSYAGNKITANALVEWGDYKIFGGLSYYDRKYEAMDPGAPEKRHDGVQEYAAGVTWKGGRDWSVTLSDRHTINDSNLAIYQYTRNILSLIAEIRL